MTDALRIAVAGLVAAGPGIALLAALGGARPLWLVSLSIPASVVVATATGMLCALVGVDFGPLPLALVTVALAVVAAVRVRHRRPVHTDATPSPRRDWGDRGRVAAAVGLAAAATGVALAVLPWLDGLGGLSTVPQEHDMIVQSVTTAYIERSGDGAPWQVLPVHLESGGETFYYPCGLHLLMAVASALTGGTVIGVNAVTVVALGIAWPLSVAGLAFAGCRRARIGTSWAVLGGGAAALVASGLYRPVFSLMQAGILPNAVTLALAPGVVGALLTLPRRTGPAIAAGLSAAGLFLVHPSAVATIGLTLAAWWLGDALTSSGRLALQRDLKPVMLAVLGAAIVLAPSAVDVLDAAAPTSGFTPDISPTPLSNALGDTLGHVYSGYSPFRGENQLSAVVLAALGLVVSVATRRALGAVVALAVWIAITLAAWVSPGDGVHSVVTMFFYHAQLRVWSHVSLLVPVVAGVGLTLLGPLGARVPPVRLGAVKLEPRAVAVGVIGVTLLAYAAFPGRGYARANTDYVVSRYSNPHFYRVNADDVRAIDWLAEHVRPGQLIMNSANDGSTYLYVERGLPIVNWAPLGLANAPATYLLLQRFNRYPTDRLVRRHLRELRVRWVYVDSVAPVIGPEPAPGRWAGTELFSLAPGLQDLDGLPGLTKRFASGSVAVYELDPSVLVP